MKQPISDKDVFRVLSSLKNSEGSYPQDLIESRRGAFTKQAAAVALLINTGVKGASSTGASQSASTASATSSGSTASSIGGASMGKILETALVIALVAEAGVATYVYREKIADFFSSIFRPKIEQTTDPTNNSTDLNTNSGSNADSPTVTPTVIATETPLPPGFTPPIQADNNNNENPQTASTADPNDDNGKHLGQTKQPTQEIKKNDNNKNK